MQDYLIMTDASDGILRVKTVLERIDLSRSTPYRKIGQCSFPRQIAISARCANWKESAVAEWMKNPDVLQRR